MRIVPINIYVGKELLIYNEYISFDMKILEFIDSV